MKPTSTTARLVARYRVPHRVAQRAVSLGVWQRCAELADASDDPPSAFTAAVNTLARPGFAPRSAFGGGRLLP